MKKKEMPEKKHNFMGDSCFGGGVSESHRQTPPKLSAREVMEEVRRWNFGGGHVLHDQICFTRYASSNSCSSGPSFLALKCKTSSSRNRPGIHTYTLCANWFLYKDSEFINLLNIFICFRFIK